MPEPRKPAPVPAWVFGKLSDQEEADLMSQALDDPALFEEMMQANEDRELLENPIYRSRLKRTLQTAAEERSAWTALWAWLNRPASRLALAGVAAAVIAVVIWHGGGSGGGGFKEQPATIVTDPATDLGTFFGLPLRDALGVRIELNRTPAEFHPGELVRATLHLPAPAAVFVLRRQADGQTRMVYPRDLSASADLSAGDTEIAFDPLPPTTDVTAPEPVRLRVLALPVGTDLRRGSIDWAKLGAYSIQEVTYNVAP
jgi:hypothetical protein